MKYLAKNKNLIIAIMLSIILAVAGFLTIFLTRSQQVDAADNYGALNENGYYSLDGVAFYAIKVKNVKYQAKSQFGEDGDLTLTITKKSGGDISNVNYNNIYKCLDGTFYYSTNGANFEEINATAKKSDASAINLAEIAYEYYPTYDLSLDSEGKIQYVKYGDTVLLDEGESLMLSFARQKDSIVSGGIKPDGKTTIDKNAAKVLETKLIGTTGNFVSDYVDFLNVTIKSNENTVVNDLATGERIDGEITKKFFGYVLTPYDFKSNANEEGLVEFKASYEHGSTMNNFGFSFYVFKKSTYQRTEDLNSSNEFSRPSAKIDTETGKGNYVVDNSTLNQFYGEYYYYYQNQKLASLTYNPERYEITITKTVFSTLTTYKFSYNKTTGEIITTKSPSPSTEDVFARDIKFVKNGDDITLYFNDIGVYDISYKAVYFKNNQKVELTSLNAEFAFKDRLTVYGVQATYNDLYTKQTELRNASNSISADITGVAEVSSITNGYKVTVGSEFVIASTNQPQVRFLSNSVLKGINNFEVYYSKDLNRSGNTFTFNTSDKNYTLNSNFTKAGYYFVKVTHAYKNFKEWGGTTAIPREDREFTQYFLFQIKDQTPNINIVEISNDGNLTENKVMSGYYDGLGAYQGSYHKNGIFFDEFVENSEFDLPTTFELERKGFEANATWQTMSLSSEEISSKVGYKITNDGHYRLIVKFGNSSSTKRYFDIDNTGISGVQANNVYTNRGNKYFSITPGTQMNADSSIIYTTANPFTLTWSDKLSGAKITANYVRFAMESSVFSENAKDYIINGTYVATDSLIRIANNPTTAYTKAKINSITANEVLNLPGLYIFRLEDEAGNVEYFTIILDNSTPVVLQGTENGASTTYEIIKSFNNIATETRIFFGTHKLVKFEGLASLSEEYLSQINGKTRLFKNGEVTYAMFNIKSVIGQYQNGNDMINKPITNEKEGYDIISIEHDENGNVIEKAYLYTITDESGMRRSYNATVNTDKTGMSIFGESGDDLKLAAQKTIGATFDNSGKETETSKRIIYYNAINYDVLYLTWTTLTPDMDAYVDLDDDGLVLEYYELVYDVANKTYKYSENPTSRIVITSSVAAANTVDGKVRIPLNEVNGKTLAGKYVLTRTYKVKNEGDTLSKVVGTDFGKRVMTFYVDRNSIISAPTGAENSPQIGSNAYLRFFDGTSGVVDFDSLFMQSQTSDKAVIRANKLPVGIYIPITKYGYISKGEFVDNMIEKDVDSGFNSFSPYKLYVSIYSPVLENGDYVEYVYSYVKNGYYKLAGYYLKNEGKDLDNNQNQYNFVSYDVTDDNASAWLTKNELENKLEWQEGIYSIKINTMRNVSSNSSSNPYLQNYYFNFEIAGDKPDFDMTAQYPSFENMEDKELLSDGKYYYSNAEQIKIIWQDLLSNYMVKIGQVSYKFSNGVRQYLTTEQIMSHQFVLTIPEGANNLSIKMSFEVYGNNASLAALFPNGNYEVEKIIVFDRSAPTTTINDLIAKDKIIGNNVSSTLLREIAERYNISTIDGLYKYFVYATTKDYMANKLFSAASNTVDTNRVYIKAFANKYDSNILETGSPLNKNSIASNIFNEQFAVINNWTKFESADEILKSDLLNIAGLYEVVELDMAGNMTIYTIYIQDSESKIELDYVMRKQTGVDINESLTLTTDNSQFMLQSREIFALTSVKFDSSQYAYIKLIINNTSYLITPFNASGKAYQLNGEEIALKDVILANRETGYRVEIFDNISNVNYVGQISVAEIGKNLDWNSETNSSMITSPVSLGFIVRGGEDAAIKVDETTIKIYALNKNPQTGEAVLTTYTLDGENALLKASVSTQVYYYITPNNANWENFVFLIVFKDNYGVQYSKLMMYNEPKIDRYTSAVNGASDITAAMQSQTNILVSTDIFFNITNSYEIIVERKINNEVQFSRINLDDENCIFPLTGSTQYKLKALTTSNSGYNGGVVVYRLTAKANLEEFKAQGADISDLDVGIDEIVYTVTIYNQFPSITLRNSNGEDITQELFNKTTTHSDDVYISYLTGNDISESYGYTSKVFLRLRGSSEGYVEIPSSYTVSAPGTYDIKIQNYNENGTLAATYERDFVIASYDVTFYSVVKYDPSDLTNPYKVITPTGNLYYNGNEIINYHYIVNSSSYEISVNNGVVATLLETKTEGSYTTYIYLIESNIAAAGSSVKFSRKIAITVIPETTNILGNSFAYFVGTDPEAVEIKSITSSSEDIFLFKNNTETSITLQWNSYYGIKENKIYYQISRDGGNTWSDKIESPNENSIARLNLEKSGNYVIMFTDLAGNSQIVSSSTGSRDRYRINFIKSVIFNVNGELPIDNAVYNGEVIISIPSSTLAYYQSNPSIVVMYNGEQISVSRNSDGNYSFTKAGNYVVYFNAKKNNNELGVEKITFTIINENDSRWAFNYLNYNNYIIDYIKYNDTYLDISKIINGNEILMSVILGNSSFDNGIYTIKMTTNDIPSQSFEFKFWLNNLKPDIEISQDEGTTTTGNIIVRLNTNNIYETIGDCRLVINGQEVLVINKEYFTSSNYKTNEQVTLTETSPYYIQIYTDSGKLIYSYKVEIVDPLNTVTIILIVVACVVVAVGVLLFFLLRKKMKVR